MNKLKIFKICKEIAKKNNQQIKVSEFQKEYYIRLDQMRDKLKITPQSKTLYSYIKNVIGVFVMLFMTIPIILLALIIEPIMRLVKRFNHPLDRMSEDEQDSELDHEELEIL